MHVEREDTIQLAQQLRYYPAGTTIKILSSWHNNYIDMKILSSWHNNYIDIRKLHLQLVLVEDHGGTQHSRGMHADVDL